MKKTNQQKRETVQEEAKSSGSPKLKKAMLYVYRIRNMEGS